MVRWVAEMRYGAREGELCMERGDDENTERLGKERGGHVRVQVSTRKSGQVGQEYPEMLKEVEAEHASGGQCPGQEGGCPDRSPPS